MNKFSIIMMIVVLGVPFAAAANDENDISDLCRQYTAHRPDPSVNFTPGIARDGHIVPPADVNDGRARMVAPSVVHVPVTVDLARDLGITAPAGLEMDAVVGMAQIYQDGQDITQSTGMACASRVDVRP